MNPPELLRVSPHQSENPIKSSLREAFSPLQDRLKPPFSLSIPSPSEYSLLNRAIAFGDLHAIVTDEYDLFTTTLLKLSTNCYPKLLDHPRAQLLWVASKLVDVAAIRADALLVSLLRQINGGDFYEPNLWLCAELVRIFSEKWDWLLDEPVVLTSALFVYLRLLVDHYRLTGGSKLEALKRMEIHFCVKVLWECFGLCLWIGRTSFAFCRMLFTFRSSKMCGRICCSIPASFRFRVFLVSRSSVAQELRCSTCCSESALRWKRS